jgi:hypothetical protein
MKTQFKSSRLLDVPYFTDLLQSLQFMELAEFNCVFFLVFTKESKYEIKIVLRQEINIRRSKYRRL